MTSVDVMAFGAHPDDIELGCGGSLLRWCDEGASLHLLVACASGYSDPQGRAVRGNETARDEGQEAARRLGAELIEGGLPVFELEFSEALNRLVLAAVERLQPDLVLTHWQGDVHHDHVALARSTQHTCRHVPRLLAYRSNWYQSDRDYAARFLVDISEFLEAKVELLQVYESEIARTEGRWLEFVRSQARLAGLQAGVQYAEAFELVKWLE